MNSFKVLTEKSTGFYKEKGSKFWAYALPLQEITELDDLLSSIKKLHPHARHFCYAYVVGVAEKQSYRVNDDGEPGGTAGLPILNQIKSADITNTLLVIARDFGGTKLGVSGLIKAYKTAAKEALDNANIELKKEQLKIILNFDFEVLGEVLSILDRHNISPVHSKYDSSIDFEIHINKEDLELQKALFQHLPISIKWEEL